MLLTILTGIILAVMISINGNLSVQYGVFISAVIIHIVGFLFAFFLCAFRKNKQKIFGHGPFWIYLGGAIGVITTVANNFAFGKISMTSLIALELLGQTVVSLVIDRTGLFGMKKEPFRKTNLIGFAFAAAGIAAMLDFTVLSAVLAVAVSFISGISVVLSRTVNARLSYKIGALPGSMVNHLVGLPVTIVIAFLALGKNAVPVFQPGAERLWIYLGGMMGVIVVMLYNITVPKLSSFRLTVLSFTGQVFAGIFLDVVLGTGKLDASFIGGILIAAGILLNLIVEKAVDRKAVSA